MVEHKDARPEDVSVKSMTEGPEKGGNNMVGEKSQKITKLKSSTR